MGKGGTAGRNTSGLETSLKLSYIDSSFDERSRLGVIVRSEASTGWNTSGKKSLEALSPDILVAEAKWKCCAGGLNEGQLGEQRVEGRSVGRQDGADLGGFFFGGNGGEVARTMP